MRDTTACTGVTVLSSAKCSASAFSRRVKCSSSAARVARFLNSLRVPFVTRKPPTLTDPPPNAADGGNQSFGTSMPKLNATSFIVNNTSRRNKGSFIQDLVPSDPQTYIHE